jgi:hypothetical protein
MIFDLRRLRAPHDKTKSALSCRRFWYVLLLYTNSNSIMTSRAASLVLRNLARNRASPSSLLVAKQARVAVSLQARKNDSIGTIRRAFSDLTTGGDSSLKKTSSDGVVGDPIDFNVASKIEGNESQVREF